MGSSAGEGEMPTTSIQTYDSSFPVQIQPDDFSCSIYTAAWVLQSVGIDVPPETMRGFMVPGLVSAQLGLLDRTGAGLVRLFRDQFGLDASNREVSFDELAERAGQQPIALGGHNWSNGVGHWVGVRRFDGSSLILANPGGTGPRFGQQALDQAAWNARAPFSAVFVEVDGSGGGSIGPAPVVSESFVSAGRYKVRDTDGQTLSVRKQPSVAATRIGSLSEMTIVDGSEFAWRQVTTSSGQTGWIADSFLQGSGSAFQAAGTGGSGVRIRSAPSAASNQIGSLEEGGTIQGAEFAFRQIRTDDGTIGWAADAFLGREG